MARKKKDAKSLSDYGLKRRYSLVHGTDIPNLAIAVADEGFYFEQEIAQDAKSGVTSIKFIFPIENEDALEVSVTYRKASENPAYVMARKLIDEEILK